MNHVEKQRTEILAAIARGASFAEVAAVATRHAAENVKRHSRYWKGVFAGVGHGR